jgi:cobalamin biosynthesis protein CobD/CbiB
VGDFEDAVYCWRSQASTWGEKNIGIILAAGAGALGVRLGMPLGDVLGDAQARPDLGVGDAVDAATLDSTVGLLWRALVVWVFMLLVLTLARIF